MDAHVNEYLAAVAAMQEMYGEPGAGRPHEDPVATGEAVTAYEPACCGQE
jgi:hypothetical protein